MPQNLNPKICPACSKDTGFTGEREYLTTEILDYWVCVECGHQFGHEYHKKP